MQKVQENPYQIEYFRDTLAREGRIAELKETYSTKYPEIKDANSAKFWDVRLDKKHSLRMEDGMTQERIKITASFLPKSARKILDIGVGYGFIEEVLLQQRKDVEIWGNDISSVALENIKKKFPGTYRQESIYTMQYPAKTFDAVFLLEVLEHIPPSKTLLVLAAIKKLLKKDGYFIFSVPLNEGLEHMKDNPNSHLRIYTIPLLHAELQIAGFTVLSYKTIYAFSSWYWFKSLIARVWKRWEPNNIIILAKSV